MMKATWRGIVPARNRRMQRERSQPPERPPRSPPVRSAAGAAAAAAGGMPASTPSPSRCDGGRDAAAALAPGVGRAAMLAGNRRAEPPPIGVHDDDGPVGDPGGRAARARRRLRRRRRRARGRTLLYAARDSERGHAVRPARRRAGRQRQGTRCAPSAPHSPPSRSRDATVAARTDTADRCGFSTRPDRPTSRPTAAPSYGTATRSTAPCML